MFRLAQRPAVLFTALALAGFGYAAQENDAPPKEKKVKPGVALDVKGQLLDTDPVDQVHNQPYKVYTAKLRQGKTYVIDLKSDNFDAYLRLESNDGKQIAEDDDGGRATDAQLIFAPEKDGTFKVVATRFGDDGTGGFHLKVRELSFKAGKKLEVGADGVKVEEQLTDKDGEDPVGGGHRCKVYSVALKAGSAYTVELDSDDFDAFLRVHDGKFRKVAQDDDGGEGLNARLVFRPTADGVYHVIATSFDGGTGAFTLRVREGE